MIKVLAIDDEPLALKQLATYIDKVPFFELVKQCGSAIEAKEVINNEVVDAIFCDINMPDLNGMDFVKQLAAPPIIVFTTAYSEYAVEGYKVNAVDYLLKPYGLDDFKHAANRVKQMYDARQNTHEATQQAEIGGDNDTLFVKSDGRIIRISISDIRFIEGMSEYVKIHIDNMPKPIVILFSMKTLEKRLPNTFMRIHRSYIINLTKIIEVNKNRVIMGEGLYLPIGDNYKDAFSDYLNQRFLGK